MVECEKADPMFWVRKPKYNTNDKVFFVKIKNGKAKVVPTAIRTVYLKLFRLEEKQYLIFDGEYETDNFISEEVNSPWKGNEKYIFSTLEEAEKMCVFTHVDFSEEQWYQCIGNQLLGQNLEDCDLPMCCGSISTIRSYIENKIKTYNGVFEVDRLAFQEIISTSICLPAYREDSLFYKLLDTLKINYPK